jgi:hypothetical protein
MNMRSLLFVFFIFISTGIFSQFHLRFLAGTSAGEYVCEEKGNVNYYIGYPYLIDHTERLVGKFESRCALKNYARFGFGLKYIANKLFIEFSPLIDLNGYSYSGKFNGVYQYFSDSAQTMPISEDQIALNGWPQVIETASSLGEHKTYAGVLSLSLGYQISEKHSFRVFICETKMLKNQFGQVLYGDSSGRREVYYEGKGSFEIFTPTTLGLNYEYMFAKHFFAGVSSSVLLRAKDQNGESFYLPAKRSMAVSLNLGFQLPNKQERKTKVKKTRKSSMPQIL